MARVNRITTALKSPGSCYRCRRVIEKGEAYFWAKPGYRGGRRVWCRSHSPRASELTTSLRSEPLAAIEAFEDALDLLEPSDPTVLEDLEAHLDELRSALGEYADQREQALDAWENGNSQMEELFDTASAARDEADDHEVESWGGDTSLLEEFTEDEPTVPDEPEQEDYDDEDEYQAAVDAWENATTAHEAWEERRDECLTAREEWAEHAEEQIDAARDMASGLEV